MPINKNAYLRYLIIHSQIKRNKYVPEYPTLQDLLDHINHEGVKISKSQLEKDLKFLKYDRNAPIEYNYNEKCYCYTEDWEFDIPLTPDEVRTVQMLISKLSLFGEAHEFKVMKDTIDKLREKYVLSRQHDNIDNYILFEEPKEFKGKEHLSTIYDALFENREISFTYLKFESDKPTERLIQPYILKEHGNRWYVIGKDKGEIKVFGLDRISKLEITANYFIQETLVYNEILEILNDAVGIMAFGYKSEDVVLCFSKVKANFIKSLPLHHSQKVIREDEKGIVISLRVKATLEFIQECILRYGEDVKVISPSTLADRVKKIYKNSLDAYRTGK